MESGNEKALEAGPLERLFKGSAMAKVLDFLTIFKDWDYSKSDIARNSGVNFRTVLRILPRLEELGVVKQTRIVGRAKMYQLNAADSRIVRLLYDLTTEIAVTNAHKMAEEEIGEQKIEVPLRARLPSMTVADEKNRKILREKTGEVEVPA